MQAPWKYSSWSSKECQTQATIATRETKLTDWTSHSAFTASLRHASKRKEYLKGKVESLKDKAGRTCARLASYKWTYTGSDFSEVEANSITDTLRSLIDHRVKWKGTRKRRTTCWALSFVCGISYKLIQEHAIDIYVYVLITPSREPRMRITSKSVCKTIMSTPSRRESCMISTHHFGSWLGLKTTGIEEWEKEMLVGT